MTIIISLYETGTAYTLWATGFTCGFVFVFGGGVGAVSVMFSVLCFVLFTTFCVLCPILPLKILYDPNPTKNRTGKVNQNRNV